MIAMASEVFSVSLAAFVFGLIFAGKIEEGWKVAGRCGFAINEIARAVSAAIFPQTFTSTGKILLITTMSFIVGQLPCVKKIKGKIDVGMFLALCYLVIIGFMVDIKGFMGSTLYITLFCICVMLVCTLIHLLITRIFKIKYEFVVLSIVAAIADGPTAALVAAGGKWGSLATVGLVCGVLGAVFGNYCGIGVAYLIKAVLGF